MRISGLQAPSIMIGVLCSLLIPRTAVAQEQVPADVQLMKSAHQSALRITGASSDVSPLSKILTQRTISLAREIATANKIDSARYLGADFSERVHNHIDGRVRRAARAADGERLGELQTVIREESSRQRAHAALAEHLGFKPAGSYVENKSSQEETAGAATSLLKAAVAVATKAEEAPAQPWLSKQMNLTGTTQRLTLVEADTQLLEDFGGSGSHNKVIDAGEWIQLKVGLENSGPRRYFSTSSWLSVSDACTYTPSTQENIAPEVEPGDKFQITGWVYVSEQCTQGKRVSVTVQSKDTHRFKAQPEAITLSLVVTNVGQAALHNTLIDRDIPGHSDGKETITHHGGGAQVEVVTGLQTAGSASTATMGYGSNSLTDTYVQSDSFEQLPMEAVAGRQGHFDATDDLDIILIVDEKYKLKIDKTAEAEGWTEESHAELLFATDTVVDFPSPFVLRPDPVPERPTLPPVEDCDTRGDEDEDGLADCEDSDCAEHKDCEPDLEPLEGIKIIDLIESHAHIGATPTKPTSGDAISAVTHGYELVLDKSGFLEQYQCMVLGIPLDKCGLPECPDCEPAIAQVEPVEEEYVPTPRPQTARYTFRNYLQLPIAWAPRPPPEPEPIVIDEPAKPIDLRLDGGLNIAQVAFGNNTSSTEALRWQVAASAITRLSARAVYGKRAIKPMVFMSAAAVDHGSRYVERLAAGGAAYTYRINNMISAEPYMLVGMASRSIYNKTDSKASKVDYLLSPGVSGLYRKGSVGVYAGLEYQVVPDLLWYNKVGISSSSLAGNVGVSKYFY
jgi:hypothetical protein